MDTSYYPYRAAPVRRRAGCRPWIVLFLIVVVLLGVGIWSGILPVLNLFHSSGPITLTTSAAPTLIISNNARNSNSLRQREAAPVRIVGGNTRGKIVIEATNIPLIGDSRIAYRQTQDHAVTFFTVDYRYQGSITITVPPESTIRLDSYENSADISGVTGRLVVTMYTGSIHLSNCILSGPSLLKSYKGTLSLEHVTLKSSSTFESYLGNITFQGELAPPWHYFFSTYQGAIVVKMPATSSFVVDASTYQHMITSDFPGLPSAQSQLQGNVGALPGAYLHLYTYQNTISLQRSEGA